MDRHSDYGITVTIADQDDEDWAQQVHAMIDVEFTLEPDTLGYTRDDLLAIYRWYVGVMGRVGVLLHTKVTGHYDRKRTQDRSTAHHCNTDPQPWTCGLFYSEGLEDARSCLPLTDHGPHVSPDLSILVPTQDAERWVTVFERIITDVLAGDLAPLEEELEARPDHTTATLAESHTTAAQEHTS